MALILFLLFIVIVIVGGGGKIANRYGRGFFFIVI
jgi:hypothetical protein